MLKGTIIENSLENKDILKSVQIVRTRLDRDLINWVLYDVIVEESQIPALAASLSDGPWYMHFWELDTDNIKVVYKEKSFTIQFSDKSSWTNAIAYGKSIGILPNQLDFPIDAMPESIKQREQLKRKKEDEQIDAQISPIFYQAKRLQDGGDLRGSDIYILKMQMNNPDLPILEKYTKTNSRFIYTQRKDWRGFKSVLDQKSLSVFIHVTDESNISSIVKYGGLYSNDAMKKYGIQPAVFASNERSRELDIHHNISDHIHLSIQKSPMMYVAEKEGRIKNPVTLKIDARFVYAKETKFSDKNATDNSANIGYGLEDFERINFQIANGRWTNEEEKKSFQAEILIKHHIPIEFITR